MSHAHAEVIFEDGLTLYGEYDGTSDVMLPKLHDTVEAVVDDWRQGEWKKCADAGHVHEPVRIHSQYGSGYSWPGMACRACKVVTDGFEPFGEGVERVYDPARGSR